MVKVFRTGPEFWILALNMTFPNLLTLVRSIQICIFWEYKGVISAFSMSFPDLDPRTIFITAYVNEESKLLCEFKVVGRTVPYIAKKSMECIHVFV